MKFNAGNGFSFLPVEMAWNQAGSEQSHSEALVTEEERKSWNRKTLRQSHISAEEERGTMMFHILFVIGLRGFQFLSFVKRETLSSEG